MIIQQLGQQGARGIPFAVARPVFSPDTIMHRLAKQRLRLLLPNDVDKVPGAIGKDDAMDFGCLLHGLEQRVERFVGRNIGEGGEALIGLAGVFAVDGSAERLGVLSAGGGLGRMEDFGTAAAVLVNAIGVAIEDLENRKRLLLRGQFARHVPCGGDGHEGVESDVVLAAECAGVGQRGGSDERAQLGAGI